MKFSDLSDDLKLMVTLCLDDADRIKLVYIFPAVISQITTFDINIDYQTICASIDDGDTAASNGSEEDDARVRTFKKLTKVTRVILPDNVKTRDQMLAALYSGVNPSIELFNGLSRMPWMAREKLNIISRYIEGVRKELHSYDGSCIKNFLDMDPELPIFNLIKQSDERKLKLPLSLGNYEDSEKLESYRNILVENESIKDMIVRLKPSREFINLLPINLIFNSVTDLDLIRIWDRSFPGDLKSILRLTPSATKLTIKLDFEQQRFTAQSLVDCIFTLEKLIHLHIRFTTYTMPSTSVAVFKDLVQLLLNSIGKPQLDKLNIESAWPEWEVVESLGLKVKPLKYLRLYGFLSGQEFEYSHRVMTIRNVSVPLSLAITKFPRTKYIAIKTADADYAERSENQDLPKIMSSLPRNKAIGFKIVTMANKYCP